jgi:hypothetical protein
MTMEKKDNESVGREDKAIKSWNSKLKTLSDSFRSKHPGVMATIFSTYDVFNKVLDHPEAFPQTAILKNTKEFCNGYARFVSHFEHEDDISAGKLTRNISTPPSLTKPASGCKHALSEYFWVNNLHPTYPVHNATAAELGRFLAGTPANIGKKCGFVDQSTRNNGRFARRDRWRL